MVTPAQRMQGWVDDLAQAWQLRLKGWASAVIGLGIEAVMDVVGRKLSKQMKPVLDKISVTPDLPPEIKPFLDELKNPTGEASVLALSNLGARIAGGMASKLLDAIFAEMSRGINFRSRSIRIGFDAALELYKRKEETTEAVYNRGGWEGLPDTEIAKLISLGKVILPSDIVLPLWLRDKEKYAALPETLLRLGLSQTQIDYLKELQYRMPGVQDVVTWLAREVLEPEMIAKYGLEDEWGGLDKTLFDKIGLKEEMALNYWRAHWQHASWSQIITMLHRGLLTADGTVKAEPKTPAEWDTRDKEGEAAAYDWFRLVEIPPYWRDALTGSAWATPTRIDIRRWWDLGVVDDDELFSLYHRLGYRGEDARKYVLWTKVYARTPQLIARYKNGYINEAEVKAELVSYGLSAERAQWVWETKVKKEAPERVADTRTITVAEIIKAVKQGQVDSENGVQLIQSLGYEDWEARFKLAVSLYSEPEIIPEERTVQIDTIRRRRRARYITRDEELNALLGLNLTSQLATAYADNDDLRLVKAAAPPPPVVPEYQTDDGKVNMDTIRLSRRQRRITRDQEITSLMELEMSDELAIAYADNDDLRLVKAT